MKNFLLIIASVLSLMGCATRNMVVASTSTIIGLEIAENPTTQLYQAKLGYNRQELAIVPSNRSGAVEPGSVGGGAKDTADVVMELRYGNIFSLQNSGIYQRLAVGTTAVSQPGAAFLFAKGSDGNLDAASAEAVSRSLKSIPAPAADVTTLKLKLAKEYQEAADKTKWDAAVKKRNYATFSDFLISATTTLDEATAIQGETK